MLDIDVTRIKDQIKAELKAELLSNQDVDLKEKEFHSQNQINKQINYNVLTQKQIQGQKLKTILIAKAKLKLKTNL